jgi:ribose 5-phosphate isomerase A
MRRRGRTAGDPHHQGVFSVISYFVQREHLRSLPFPFHKSTVVIRRFIPTTTVTTVSLPVHRIHKFLKRVPGVQKGIEEKKTAGYRAAEMVEDGMVVGLGTGSTVHYTLERLSTRVTEGLSIRGVPTSYQTAQRAQELGIPLTTLEEVEMLDLAIDGADQMDRHGFLIKGRGAAHVREKIVADAAKELVIVITAEKLTDALNIPVPLEVIPFARTHVARAVSRLQGTAQLRQATRKDGPVLTDNGNMVLDCDFGEIQDPPSLEWALETIPGVVGSGLFTRYIGQTRVVVGEDGRTRILTF